MQEQQQQRQTIGQTQGQGSTQKSGQELPELPLNVPQGTPEQLPTLAEWNNRYIDYVLNVTKGKKTAAARILGINRRTLYRRNKSKSSTMTTDADSTH